MDIIIKENLEKAGVSQKTISALDIGSEMIVNRAENCDIWGMSWVMIDTATAGAKNALTEGQFAAVSPLAAWRDELLRKVVENIEKNCGCTLMPPPEKK